MLGVVAQRCDETEIRHLNELHFIDYVISDPMLFAEEKWRIASDKSRKHSKYWKHFL